MKTVFDKLRERIMNDTGMDTTNYRPTYAAYKQRSIGSFVWYCDRINFDGTRTLTGSTLYASVLLKHSGKLVFDKDGEIVRG